MILVCLVSFSRMATLPAACHVQMAPRRVICPPAPPARGVLLALSLSITSYATFVWLGGGLQQEAAFAIVVKPALSAQLMAPLLVRRVAGAHSQISATFFRRLAMNAPLARSKSSDMLRGYYHHCSKGGAVTAVPEDRSAPRCRVAPHAVCAQLASTLAVYII